MDLTNFVLPYPYEAYTRFNRTREKFEEYKDKINGWVLSNTVLLPDMASYVKQSFSYVERNHMNREVPNWILSHLDKIRYIGDFSGLDFGIVIDEEKESVYIRFPSCIEEVDKPLYPDYDEVSFCNMGIIERLEWMNEHCDFIPFRVIHEDICISGTHSHKFSHMQRNSCIMELLKPYLESSKYLPRGHIYYSIEYNTVSNQYYLKRDLDKSPKNYELPVVNESGV